jgi:hypothetical protein
MALSVLLCFLLWPWYWLSFCPFYYEHDIVCSFVLSIRTMVLSVLLCFLLWPWYCLSLSFLIWPWYCLSFCSFYYDHDSGCPFVFSVMTMVLSVLLSFLLWPCYCLSFDLLLLIFLWNLLQTFLNLHTARNESAIISVHMHQSKFCGLEYGPTVLSSYSKEWICHHFSSHAPEYVLWFRIWTYSLIFIQEGMNLASFQLACTRVISVV